MVDAPKDVRRLEALKPSNIPTMRERHDAAVSKEKRLEAAANPLVSSSKSKSDDGKDRKKKKQEQIAEVDESSDDEKFEDDESEEDEKPPKPVTKKRKLAVVNEADLKNIEALEEDDEIREGVVWSDSE